MQYLATVRPWPPRPVVLGGPPLQLSLSQPIGNPSVPSVDCATAESRIPRRTGLLLLDPLPQLLPELTRIGAASQLPDSVAPLAGATLACVGGGAVRALLSWVLAALLRSGVLLKGLWAAAAPLPVWLPRLELLHPVKRTFRWLLRAAVGAVMLPPLLSLGTPLVLSLRWRCWNSRAGYLVRPSRCI